MKKNKLLLLFGLLLTASCAYGQGKYPKSLVIKRQGNLTTQVFQLHNIDKITFGESKMHVTMKNGWTVPENGLYALNQIEKCTFSTELPTTKNEEILQDKNSFACYEEGNMLHFIGLEKTDFYALRIFNVSGVLIYAMDNYNASDAINTAQWPSGIYLITLNNLPIKFVKQ